MEIGKIYKITNIENYLLDNGFIRQNISKNKNGYYLIKTIENSNNSMDNKPYEYIVYMKQHGFKEYIFKEFNITTYRQPDEAFLIKIGDKFHLKILEKKNQNVTGSVEDKIKTGYFNKEEYIIMFESLKDIFIINYAFCVSDFLEKKLESSEIKYQNIKKINEKYGINIFYGNRSDYFDKILEWIYSDKI